MNSIENSAMLLKPTALRCLLLCCASLITVLCLSATLALAPPQEAVAQSEAPMDVDPPFESSDLIGESILFSTSKHTGCFDPEILGSLGPIDPGYYATLSVNGSLICMMHQNNRNEGRIWVGVKSARHFVNPGSNTYIVLKGSPSPLYFFLEVELSRLDTIGGKKLIPVVLQSGVL